MATKVITALVDDIDGSEATETIRFALDGQSYEIDLGDANAAALRASVTAFVTSARKSSGSFEATSAVRSNKVELVLIRAWALDQGISVGDRGRIAASVVAQYRAAH
ncbi:Lsr2 family protein [Nakamurella antarctica]|uniref:Lsr2 family protein n=1 Tax=Nakamurella antarctica TaxID=1902245 RepID=A0A3G8ZWZ6_9ACTN|nr:Lsr2 family protein [Nakamurella antarctica]AZI58181.1 Lsr2 family protein [Nakamurella antarctica]